MKMMFVDRYVTEEMDAFLPQLLSFFILVDEG